jgi:hypothetical protein
MFQGIRAGLGSLALTDWDDSMEVSHALNLFNTPKLEVGIKRYLQTSLLPLRLTNEGPIEFLFPANSQFFYQLNSARLFAQYQILDGSGDPIDSFDAVGGGAPAGDGKPVVALVNTFPTAIWSSIDVTIGDSPITSLATQNHPYKAYFEYFCSYGNDAQETHLLNNLCIMDTCDQFDSLDPTKNLGLAARSTYCHNSRSFQSYLPLSSCDFMQVTHLLPPGVKFGLKLTRGKDEFALMSDNGFLGNYKVHLQQLRMFINLVDAHESVTKLIMDQWLKTPIVLPLNRTEVKHFIVTAGAVQKDISHMFHGAIPKQVLIAFVTQSAFTGSYAENPFKLDHFDLSNIGLRWNGEQWPQMPYEVDCKKGHVARLLGDGYSSTGIRYDK